MVQYPARAAPALGFLKRSANDVDIYVEDTANPNMWMRILRNLLPVDVRIRSVNMLGGRKNVLDACRLDQIKDGRRKLYIIDGDFDHFYRKPKPRLRNLHRLRCYCVENMLISRSAITTIGAESSPKLDEGAIEAAFEYDAMLASFQDHLKPLFIAYAAAMKVAPNIKTVKYSVYKLMDQVSGLWEINRWLVLGRIREIILEIKKLNVLSAFNVAYRSIARNVEKWDAMMLVSGKDYLLPVILGRLKSRLKLQCNMEQFKVRLAGECSSSIDPWFCRTLRSL